MDKNSELNLDVWGEENISNNTVKAINNIDDYDIFSPVLDYYEPTRKSETKTNQTNQTNQINQINQTNQTNQTNKINKKPKKKNNKTILRVERDDIWSDYY